MNIKLLPIDEASDLSLVYINKKGHVCCKNHGAMNCNHIDDTHKFYRCYSVSTSNPEDRHLPVEQRRWIDRACEAACKISKIELSELRMVIKNE